MFSHFFGTKQVNENCSSVETFVKEILYGCGVFKTKVTHFFGFKLTHSVVVVLFVLEGWGIPANFSLSSAIIERFRTTLKRTWPCNVPFVNL